MRIECPQCGASGNIDLAKRPPSVNAVRCRQCRASIPLPPAKEPPVVGAATSVPPAAKPVVPGPAPGTPFAPAPAPSSPPPKAPQAACRLCHQTFLRSEMVRFGPDWVCAGCKPSYVDMLQQGIGNPAGMHYGGFWIRFGAKFLDGLIIWLVLLAVNLVLGFASGALFGSKAMTGVFVVGRILLQIVLPAVYTAFFLTRYRATPGKMACGLEVVTPEGETLGLGRAIGRHFAEWLSSLLLCIGYIMAGFDEEKRALHDRICATRVVYR